MSDSTALSGRLPDFLIIGAQKSGTTWLARQLAVHSRIFVPHEEIHFFDHTDKYELGPDWYAARFAEGAHLPFVGEKTPEYLYLPKRDDVPEGAARIHEMLPDVKLIVIFRDPVDRAVSAVNHLIQRKHISPLHSVDTLLVGRKRKLLPWPVIEMGMYHEQIAPFVELYGREALLVLYYEDDVVGRPASTVGRVCDFLGAPREAIPEDHLNRTPNRPRRSRVSLAVDYHVPVLSKLAQRHAWRFDDYYPQISDSARRTLYDLYGPHNRRLFDLVGRRPTRGWTFQQSDDDTGEAD